jgi:predicted O-linked N-acetylglucosamine transferase (SPINDLY family)
MQNSVMKIDGNKTILDYKNSTLLILKIKDKSSVANPMSNSSIISSDTEVSKPNPVSCDVPLEPALQLLRQGNQFASCEQFSDADSVFRAAASLPGGKLIWNFKSLGFCPTVFPDVPGIDAYWQQLDQGLDQALAEHFEIDWRTLPADGFIPHFNLPHQGRSYKDIRAKFAHIFEPFFPQERPARQSRQRYRIGFLVFSGQEGGFLRDTAGILRQLDRKRFEVVVLCPGSLVDRCRQTIHSDDITFVPLRGTFEQIVGQARESDCDLVYHWKAGSDPWGYFMPFARLAPIQCTSYGTHGTSGIPAVDYFLSSRFVEPSDAEQYYSERLLCMNAVPTYQQRRRLPENATRDEFGLPEQGSIYFCPHRLAKYHPSFDTIFRQILERDPQGHLVLLTGRNPLCNDALRERSQRNLGTALMKRIIFFPILPVDKYLRILSLSTMIIDSPVYAGDLTLFDAFSFGIPEVTLSGELYVQNFATGIYRRMGLDDLPCRTMEQYVDLAVRLGTEPDFRQEVSRRILERNHLIFENADTVCEHERLFELMLES